MAKSKTTKKTTRSAKSTKTKPKAKSPAKAKKRVAKKSTTVKKKVASKRAPATKSSTKSSTKPSKKQVTEEVTIDRRNESRRDSVQQEPVASVASSEKVTPVPTPGLERRAKVNRRRQIDPTTCERDYSDHEVEFMNALDEYKRSSGRMFPTCSEVLEVIRGLGYTQLSPAEIAARGVDEADDLESTVEADALEALEESRLLEDEEEVIEEEAFGTV